MRKWSFVVLFLTVFLALLCVTAGACAETSGSCGNNVTYVLDDNGVLIISGTGEMHNYDNFFDSLLAPWYIIRDSIKTIEIEDGVTSIGNYAFYNCSGLTSVTIPDSVTSIGIDAFWNCSSLTSVTIPDGMTSIDGTFGWCSSLTSVTIPDSVTGIGNYAFYNCSSLTNVTIPDSVTSIGNYVFYNCNSLTSVTIPDSVTSIGNSAFSFCSGLTSVTIPNSVTSIGYAAFSVCSSLTSVTIPDSVTSIGKWAFDGCSGLTRVTIPNSVTSIGDCAFSGCSGLTNVTIPDSVTSIGDSTFSGCSSLKSVTFPNSLTSIGYAAFRSCIGLTSVMIPDGVTSIGDYAFSGCSGLTSVTIPDSVTSMGEESFYNCRKLKKLLIPESVTTFGSNIVNSDPVIYCYSFSEAENWALDEMLEIVYLDSTSAADLREITMESDFRVANGDTRQIIFNVFPDCDAPTVTWTSSAQTVAGVVDGVLTAYTNGTAIISAACDEATASVTVTVYTAAADYSLPSEIWVLAKESYQFVPENLLPADAEVTMTWSVSDTNIASINSNGLLTSVKTGDITVTGISERGIIRECLVHLCHAVTAIAFAEDAVSVGQGCTAQLTANVTMRTQSCVNHLVTFSSSDEAVASVSESGMVTARALGTATITATAASDVSAECAVTVRAANVLTLPANTQTIESEAFANLSSVDKIVIPATVTSIADDAFSGSNITIVAPADSYAANWASEHSIPCIIQ